MKRLLCLILAAPCLAGCVEMELKLRDTSSRPVVPVSAITTPIVADQVNRDNARRMAQALWDEMEREEIDRPSPVKGR